METIIAHYVTSVSELKKSPSKIIKELHEPVAILNHNRPEAYLVPAKLFEKMVEALEDKFLLELAQERLKEEFEPIEVNIDEL